MNINTTINGKGETMKKILIALMWLLIIGGLGGATAGIFLGFSAGGFVSGIALSVVSFLSLVLAITHHTQSSKIKKLKKKIEALQQTSAQDPAVMATANGGKKQPTEDLLKDVDNALNA